MPPPTPFIRKTLRMLLLAALFMAMAGTGAYVALNLIVKGESTVIVPNLVGRDVLSGLVVLSDLGLNARVGGTVYDNRVPRNHIIDQDPEAGSSIKRGRDVRIHVSRGPESVVMPDLAGLSLQQSRILLMENDLCLGTISRMHRSGTAREETIAHYPTAGATLTRSQCVDLLVSRGNPSPALAMIDLDGSRIDAALHRLQRLGLAVDTLEAKPLPGRPPDTVVEQSPPVGWRITADTRIALSVNRSDAGSTVGDPIASRASGLFRFSPGSGFYKKRLRVEYADPPVDIALFDDFVSPGQEIWLLIPKNDNPSVRVFVDGQPVAPAGIGGRWASSLDADWVR